MKFRAVGCGLYFLALAHSPAATVSTPAVSLPVLRSDFVLDPATTSGNPGAQSSRTESTGPDGSTITELHASYVASGSRTTTLPDGGGGTLHWATNQSFDGTLVQSVTTTADSWRYQSSFTFRNALEYTASATTSGRFFFVLSPSNENTLAFDRYARIVVDQPLALRLSLSAAFSQGYFSEATGSAGLLADPFNFLGIMFSNSLTNMTGGTDPTHFQKSGTKGSIDYTVTASGTRDGIDYDIRLTPNTPGSAEEIELRWVLDYESSLQGLGVNRLAVDEEVSGAFQESLTITVVPEPTPVFLLGLALVSGICRRSRRGSTNFIHLPQRSIPSENRELPD